MKKISTLFLLLLSQFSFSQNLVQNYSFEDTVSCPPGLDGIADAVGWNTYRETPDYFNSCNNSCQTSFISASCVGVPRNYEGYQYALTGNAYAGFVTFVSTAHNYREYIGSDLLQPLTIGQKYFVSFFVSLALDTANYVNGATNKIGVTFSTIPYSYYNRAPITNNAQVYSDSVITDTTNWVKISGSFISDSLYNYIILGNFFNDSSTAHIALADNFVYCYYYIDDIRLSTDSMYVNGINEYNSLNLIKIIPNPARDWIAVEGSDLKSFSVFDISGRRCIEDAFAATSLKSIYIGNLSKGVYFIHVNTLNRSFIQKLIIQ